MALTNEEKGQLARKITRGTSVVCSSIAQLHMGSPDPNASLATDETGIIRALREHGEDKWKFTNIEGALLLTRDKHGICNFRIYDLNVFRLRFQCELYENMDYQRLSDKFHAFEIDTCICGFCFSDASVAAKFFDRVQGNIIRNNKPIYASTPTSPSFQPPGPSTPSRDAGDGGYFLQNGLLDADHVPSEWKRILKQAGIKKKDLKNPQLQDAIRDVLAQYNISLDPPPLDMNDDEIRQYYTDEELEQYERYKRDMTAYEEDMRRYEKEMEEYEKQQAREKKLQEMLEKNEREFEQAREGGLRGEEALRQSMKQFTGSELRNLIIPKAVENEMAVMPRMSVARPDVPALPPIPKKETKEEKLKRIAPGLPARGSTLIVAADFLNEIKKKEKFDLRRISALPKLDGMKANKKQDLMQMLMDRVNQQRKDLGEEDSDGGESEFSEPSDV